MGTQNASQINDLRFKAENEDGVVLGVRGSAYVR